jgi:hypothetical protein
MSDLGLAGVPARVFRLTGAMQELVAPREDAP